MKKLVSTLLKLLIEKKLTIAFAESVTCGLASHQLNIVKGTSEAFMGSVVCYNECVKTNLLGIDSSLIDQYTAESQQVTDALAKNLHQLFDADMFAAITGLAAPGGSETSSKPVGTIFFSLMYKGRLVRQKKFFSGTPLQIKKKACEELYKLMLRELKE